MQRTRQQAQEEVDDIRKHQVGMGVCRDIAWSLLWMRRVYFDFKDEYVVIDTRNTIDEGLVTLVQQFTGDAQSC